MYVAHLYQETWDSLFYLVYSVLDTVVVICEGDQHRRDQA